MNKISKALEAYNDHEEVMSWLDEDSYNYGEIRTHMDGLYRLAKEAADLIDEYEYELVMKHNLMVKVIKEKMKVDQLEGSKVRLTPVEGGGG